MSEYPFAAIVGQEDIKEALLLNLINPAIGGVLIDGTCGTGKSLAARAVVQITDSPLRELPLNISEDRLTGSIDLEKTLRNGVLELDPGLLSAADGGILYADDVSLLPDHITDILLQVLSSGENRVERDGLSYCAPCKFLLIGTMNSGQSQLRKSLTDYFGLYARARDLQELPRRLEIMHRRDAYDANSEVFARAYEAETARLRQQIVLARELLPEVELGDRELQLIVAKTTEACAEGHRADLVMYQTVRAVAAFHGRTEVVEDDIDEAAYFALPHRRRSPAPPQPEEEQRQDEPPEEPEEEQDDQEQQEDTDSGQDQQEQPQQSEEENGGDQDQSGDQGNRFKSIPQAFAVGEPFQVTAFAHQKDRKCRTGAGRRTQTRTTARSGRYIYPTMQRQNDDLALDATIRAAAPYQRIRPHPGVAVAIREEDIREKIRQKRVANLLVFVVDASGSMGAMQRMVEAKGAVLSLLKDAYVKRDKVAMVTFRGNEAQVILPPTRSVERGYRLLQDIQTGGKTPLNAGIQKGLQVIQSQLRQQPDLLPMLIVLTDGKGNVSLEKGKKPVQELLEIGEKVSKVKQIETMVIDIERNNLMQFGIAKKLADAMGGRYHKLDQMKSSAIVDLITKERQNV